MAGATNARQVNPTGPITAALVGTSPVLLSILRKLAERDDVFAEALRRYEAEFTRMQGQAESLAQLIEKRLKAVEGAALDVTGGLGNVIRLSDAVAKPVASSGSAGSGTKATREGHVHAGVHSVNGHLGDVEVGTTTERFEADGSDPYVITLSAAAFAGSIRVYQGTRMSDGDGCTITYPDTISIPELPMGAIVLVDYEPA